MTSQRSRASQHAPPGRWIRAVVTDVDGTLTDGARRLDPEAVEVLHRVEDRGIPILLATGNVLPIALAIHRSLGLTGPIVAENGGIVYTREGETERVERLADRRVALRAYRRLRERGIPVRRLFTDRWRETEVALEPTVPVSVLRRAVAGIPVRVEGTGFALHLMERGAGKLRGLRRALATIGLAPSDCLIAGDGDNDVEMLRAAGWAVTFHSASPRARRVADYVARADFGCGFVEGLKASGVLDRPVRSRGHR